MSLISSEDFPDRKVLTEEYAFTELFYGNTHIKSHATKPLLLPATTLTASCYSSMFNGCTSLTKAPALPATTLANNCYEGMFYKCSNLTKAPDLPAPTLEDDCYSSMFYKCTSLTTAPDLPAPTLVFDCYTCMFKDCTSLSSVKCLATDFSADYHTMHWLDGVAASGTFTKASSATGWSTGDSGIPSGWTVVSE